ncbi:MAG: HYR domain-containing protein, partial [Bacteroidota bacterium]
MNHYYSFSLIILGFFFWSFNSDPPSSSNDDYAPCSSSDIAVVASPDQCLVPGTSVVISAQASGGGGGPYTYLWSPDDGSISDVNSASPTISPSVSTVYLVRANGYDGCFAYDSVRVQVGGCCIAPPTIHCPPDFTACPGTSTHPSTTGMATGTEGPNCWPPIITFSDYIVSTGPCAGEKVIERTWLATDPDNPNRTDECVQRIVLKADAPQITCPADQTVNCASDIYANPGAAMVMTDCSLGFQVSVSGPVINGTEECPYTTYTYTYTVTDDCGRTASCQQVFTIDNSAPIISCPGSSTVDCEDDIVVNENDVSVIASCGLGFTVSISGPVITGGGGSCDNRTFKYTYTATDDCGRSVSCNRFFHIDNDQPPVPPAPPADITLECDDLVPSAPVLIATDDCGGNISASASEESIPGSCPQEFTLKRTWTFVDACGNSVSISQRIFLEDNTPPVFVHVPADEDVCGSPPPFGTPTIQDNCGAISIGHRDTIIWGNCTTGEKKIRIWTATDECGNSSTASQTIIFNHDDTPPEFWDCPYDITVNAYPDCEAVVDWYPPTATDNCGVKSITSNFYPGDTFDAGMTTVTYTAVDDCGNEATCSFKITVIAPELKIECPDDIHKRCDYGYSGTRVYWNDPVVTSSCSSNPCSNNPPYIYGFVYMGQYNDHHYYCSTFPADWAYAKAYSESAGGYLAVINDAQENQFLTNLIQAPAAYIGLSDHNIE